MGDGISNLLLQVKHNLMTNELVSKYLMTSRKPKKADAPPFDPTGRFGIGSSFLPPSDNSPEDVKAVEQSSPSKPNVRPPTGHKLVSSSLVLPKKRTLIAINCVLSTQEFGRVFSHCHLIF